MNILFLCDLDAGGEWTATYALIKNIKELSPNTHISLIVSTFKTWQIKKMDCVDTLLMVVKKPYNKPLKYYREYYWEIREFVKIIRAVLKNQKIDYVVATYYIAAIAHILSSENPYIFYFHGIRNNYKVSKVGFNHFMILKKYLEKIVLSCAQKIIVPSLSLQKFVPINRQNNVYHLVNLIRKEFFRPKKNIIISNYLNQNNLNNKKLIIYSGRLINQKGIRLLTKAFCELRKKYEDARLVFCFPEIQNKEQDCFIHAHRKDKTMFFMKNLDAAMLSFLYTKASFSVFPSHAIREASPLSYLEPIASGIPVIASDIRSVRRWSTKLEIVDDCCFFKKNSCVDLHKKMVYLLEHKPKYKKIFYRAKIQLMKYQDRQTIVNRFFQIIQT